MRGDIIEWVIILEMHYTSASQQVLLRFGCYLFMNTQSQLITEHSLSYTCVCVLKYKITLF